jgi:hypothetical protein
MNLISKSREQIGQVTRNKTRIKQFTASFELRTVNPLRSSNWRGNCQDVAALALNVILNRLQS